MRCEGWIVRVSDGMREEKSQHVHRTLLLDLASLFDALGRVIPFDLLNRDLACLANLNELVLEVPAEELDALRVRDGANGLGSLVKTYHHQITFTCATTCR